MVVYPVLDSGCFHPAGLAHAKVLQGMTGYHTSKRANLSEWQRKEVARRYLAGETGAELAAEFGCVKNYPNFLAKKYGNAQPKIRYQRKIAP